MNAITEQAGKLGHISNLFYAEPYVKAAERLCRKAGMSNVFFANSGAESNEGLIKLARKYSFDKYGKGQQHRHHPEPLLPRPDHHHPHRHRAGQLPQLLLPL